MIIRVEIILQDGECLSCIRPILPTYDIKKQIAFVDRKMYALAEWDVAFVQCDDSMDVVIYGVIV